ncbi:MAG TPA: isochorismatase family protein [Nocardioides sp.]|uniref:cysteine hydrolase family protein n=1 Tax=uncultured Nocardioides sp. TaxID=198441 RepID=UPI002626C1FD|nr:isochorismatase family protein [uncultured Nocardioides sp.]HRD59714.1 isochorismatase family protein [Nocardioides sp.]HRI94817.1 isochorismatase family protein [Nocardioides sp.]HRK47051.1 isochorismatase family protein [Nocardioides sp.]
MATVRAGGRGALVVVDVQVGVVEGAWEADRVVGNVTRAVDRARAAGVPVVWVQHEDDELVRDTPVWQWVPELIPAEGEARVFKRFNSSFERTTLDDELARLDVSHLALAGAATNWCIRATAYAALERGYDLTLVGDAHTTVGEHAAEVVDDLNTVMRWVSYAEVTNTTASAEEINFSALS